MSARLRLEFTRAVQPKATASSAIHKCWFQLPTGLATAGDLAARIAEEFSLNVRGAEELQLIMDGFAVLPGSAVDVIRDGDLVKVQRAPGQRAGPRAQSDAGSKPAGRVAPKPGVVGALQQAAGGQQPSHKRKATAPTEQLRPAKKAAMAAPVATAAESSSSDDSSSEAGATSSEEEEESSEEAATSSEEEGRQAAAPPAATPTPKGPSRNARRKKLKRQLRREGVLPGGRRPAASGVVKSAAAAVGSTTALPATPPASQRPAAAAQQQHVGTPAAKPVSSQQQRAHQAGHVRFGDSDAEETVPGGLAVHAERAPDTAVPHTPAQHQAAVDDANDTEDGYNAQRWDYSRQQERRQKRAGQRHTASVIALQPAQADDRLRPLPLVDEGRLQPLTGEPQPGDVLSYRLLEIGENFSPQVSARRQGKVTAYDPGSKEISLEPWPRPGIHPVWAERAQAVGIDYYKYIESMDDGDEEPPTEYDADGGLTISFHSLADVAAVTVTVSLDSPAAQRSPPSATAGATVGAWALQTGANAHSARNQPAKTQQPNGEAVAPASSPPAQAAKSGSAPNLAGPRARSETPQMATPQRLVNGSGGPPRPASTGPSSRPTAASAAGRAIPSINEWVELSKQLQQRRAELAASNRGGSSVSPLVLNGSAESATHGSRGGHSPAAAKSGMATRQQQQLPQPPAKQVARVPGKMTAGAARPHGGVRHTALGSVLRRLRAEGDADSTAAEARQ